MTLSEMPKVLHMNRPLFEIQLGLRPLYHLELVNTRTLRRKPFMMYLEDEKLIAPRNYRIARVWKGTVSPDTEVHL